MLNPAAFLLVGASVVCAVWLPRLFRGSPLTLPVFAVALGAALSHVWPKAEIAHVVELMPAFTQAILVFAVMAAGISIDRKFNLKAWLVTWRLLGLVMPICIAITAVLAVWLLSMPLGLAIALAAILAPTDPVLAAEVGLGPPGEGEESQVRFALTSEAGLNDGLASPFVVLGLLMTFPPQPEVSYPYLSWLFFELMWKVAAGVALGAGLGIGLVRLNRSLPDELCLTASGEGIALIGVMFFVYGTAEILSMNGFVAVFSAGVAIRQTAQMLAFTQVSYAFADQLERLLMTMILFLFGTMVAAENLPNVTSASFLFVTLSLFVVRPLVTLAAFWGAKETKRERRVIGLLGIRGLGTLYYLFLALGHGVPRSDIMPIVTLALVMSIAVYGLIGDKVMARLEYGPK